MPFVVCSSKLSKSGPDLSPPLQPIGQSPVNPALPADGIRSQRLFSHARGRHIKRNSEIPVLWPNVLQRGYVREARDIGEIAIRGDDARDMVVGQKTLRALARVTSLMALMLHAREIRILMLPATCRPWSGLRSPIYQRAPTDDRPAAKAMDSPILTTVLPERPIL